MSEQGEPEEFFPQGIRRSGDQSVRMTGRQRAVFEGLVNIGPKDGPRHLGTIYEGTLTRLADTAAVDGAAYAAHGARELMEKLGWRVNDDTPEQRGSLGDRAAEIESAYEAAVQALPPERALWTGIDLASEVVTVLDTVAYMIEWRQSNTLSRSSLATVMVDFSIGEIPGHIQAEKQKEWTNLRDFFTKVAHHRTIEGRVQTVGDVAERFRELEDFLYARWAPETVRDFAEIDELIGKRDT